MTPVAYIFSLLQLPLRETTSIETIYCVNCTDV